MGNPRPICFSLSTLNHTRSFYIFKACPITAHTDDFVHSGSPHHGTSIYPYWTGPSKSGQMPPSTAILDLANFKKKYYLCLSFDSTLYLSYGIVHIWACYKIICTHMLSPLADYKFLEYQSTQNIVLTITHVHSNSHWIPIYLIAYIKFSLLFC